MGFNGWRNLSVLLLAGAALVGCNNTPTKDKTIIAPKSGDSPIGLQQKQGPFNGAGQPVGLGNSNTAFPTQSQGPPAPQFTAQPIKVGGDPPQFPPLPPNPGSNIQPPPSPFGQQTNPSPFGQAPNMQKSNSFGDSRTSVPPTMQPSPTTPNPFSDVSVPRPDAFDKR